MGIVLKNSSAEVTKKFEPLFNPRSVAFVGASNERSKWGFVILNNLINGGYQGKLYPVNPREEQILDLTVYKSIGDIPESPDLAVIIVPPLSVVSVLRECIDKGIRAGIVITAGFAELGDQGLGLQQEMVDVARSGGMILVGPNCNGIMNPWNKVHIQFPAFFPPPGPIAVVAQSGNVVDSMARQIMLRGFGCSRCVSSGNEADLHSEDYFEHLAEDPHTRVILAYIEGFKDGQRFFDVAREVTRKKPLVILKAGKTLAGAKAARSHTAAIAGSDAVFEAVCSQSGVIRAKSLGEMLNIGVSFLRQPLPQDHSVGIVTGGGGWGVLAADACTDLGLDVVSLPEETISELDSFLPPWWSRGNPVDLVAGGLGEVMFKSVELLLACPSVDGTLVMSIMPVLRLPTLSPSADAREKECWEENMVQAVVQVIGRFNTLAERYQKPVIVASEQMFADAMSETRIIQALGQMNAVCYQMPHHAAVALASLVRYGKYLRTVRRRY
ncbi:acetate--CoA ligase family protein [Thermodesulfobacteriota bacterium]